MVGNTNEGGHSIKQFNSKSVYLGIISKVGAWRVPQSYERFFLLLFNNLFRRSDNMLQIEFRKIAHCPKRRMDISSALTTKFTPVFGLVESLAGN